MGERRLIFIGNDWVIAERVPGASYSWPGIGERDVWSDPASTGLLCIVGEEKASYPLPERLVRPSALNLYMAATTRLVTAAQALVSTEPPLVPQWHALHEALEPFLTTDLRGML